MERQRLPTGTVEAVRAAGLCGIVAFVTFNVGWIAGDLAQPRAFSPTNDDISYLRASTTVRIYGMHGVSGVFDWLYRTARYPFQPEIWNRASLFSVYYTIMQGW